MRQTLRFGFWFGFLSAAALGSLLWQGTKKSSTGVKVAPSVVKPEVAEAENRHYNDNPELTRNILPVRKTSLFPETLSAPVVNVGKRELNRLTKISKPIQAKLISSKAPEAKVDPGGTTDFDESIYDFGRMMTVTFFSAMPTCGGSGATNAQLSLFLSTDKAKWVLIGRSTGCNALRGATKLKARYAGWRAEIKSPFIGPASISLREAPVLRGYINK